MQGKSIQTGGLFKEIQYLKLLWQIIFPFAEDTRKKYGLHEEFNHLKPF